MAENLVYIFLKIVIINYNALEKMISDKNKFYFMILESIHGFTRSQAETIDEFPRLDK
jgi:hypothetical protein